jgi:hypothetical protein
MLNIFIFSISGIEIIDDFLRNQFHIENDKNTERKHIETYTFNENKNEYETGDNIVTCYINSKDNRQNTLDFWRSVTAFINGNIMVNYYVNNLSKWRYESTGIPSHIIILVDISRFKDNDYIEDLIMLHTISVLELSQQLRNNCRYKYFNSENTDNAIKKVAFVFIDKFMHGSYDYNDNNQYIYNDALKTFDSKLIQRGISKDYIWRQQDVDKEFILKIWN